MEKPYTTTVRCKTTPTTRWGHLIAICMVSLSFASCLDDEDRCPEGTVLVKKDASADDFNWFDVCIVPPDTATDTGTGTGRGIDTGTGTQVVDTGSGSGSVTDTGTGSGSGSGIDTDSVTETGTDTDSAIDTDSSTGTDANTDTDTNTDTATESSVDDTGTGTEVAPCTTGSCSGGEYCDLTMTPPTCLPPPTGQGQTCATAADCAAFEASYCESTLTKTCLRQYCDIDANNCSDGYMCCGFAFWGLPNTCVSKGYWGETCYVPPGK